MKTRIVIFDYRGGRVLKGVDSAAFPGCLVNPDLSAIAGVQQEYWKADYSKNAVVPMSPEEKALRDRAGSSPKQARSFRRRLLPVLAHVSAGLVLGALFSHFFLHF